MDADCSYRLCQSACCMAASLGNGPTFRRSVSRSIRGSLGAYRVNAPWLGKPLGPCQKTSRSLTRGGSRVEAHSATIGSAVARTAPTPMPSGRRDAPSHSGYTNTRIGSTSSRASESAHWKARQSSRSVAPAPCVTPPSRIPFVICSSARVDLDLHPRPQLDHSVSRQPEELVGANGIAAHRREETFAPVGHAASRRGNDLLATEEVGGLEGRDVQTMR